LIQNEQESHMWKMEAVWRKCGMPAIYCFLHCCVLIVFSLMVILIQF